MPVDRPTRPTMGLDLVTGAFGNVGAGISARLLAQGGRVRTLTNHPPATPAPTDGPASIDVRPYSFHDPARLAAAFEGVGTFYNTFWMRTGDRAGYALAVERSLALVQAAERAGVRRIVHVSVAHADASSPYPYFRAKAEVEQALLDSPAPVAIVRPSLIFGGASVLLDNLAWILRRAPVFGVAGDGLYRVRPVHVDDVAALCVARADGTGDEVIDAVGPERPSFLELVTLLRDAVGSRARIVRLPVPLVLAGARALGIVLRDQVLTRDELLSTKDGLADTDGPATGPTALSDWLPHHAAGLGLRYHNERRARA